MPPLIPAAKFRPVEPITTAELAFLSDRRQALDNFSERTAVGPIKSLVTSLIQSEKYGTPLAAHLTQLGIQTLIVCGESTSGCVRASAVDAYSHGYHVVLVEECCFDRSALSHKVNLFDMHHKYADVMRVDEVITHLAKNPAVKKAS